jgi:hypothetical protein
VTIKPSAAAGHGVLRSFSAASSKSSQFRPDGWASPARRLSAPAIMVISLHPSR